MNRNQRRRRPIGRNENRFSASRNKGACHIEEVHYRHRSRSQSKEKSVTNKCCNVTPDQKDFGQSCGTGSPSISDGNNTEAIVYGTEQLQNMLEDLFYDCDPSIPEINTPVKELQKVLSDSSSKVKTKLQHVNQDCGSSPAYVETFDGTQVSNVDSIDDIDNLLTNEETPYVYERLPKHIFISEVPHVKIIAEKFSKYKRNNIEVRKLDEKVVCVEYDIFDQSINEEVIKPVQRMRAFFSIKPVFDKKDADAPPRLPSNIKNKFDILDEDLEKLTDKEIEILDGKIEENKSYLMDLRRILKRNQVIKAKKNKTSLDLQSLYEMAKRDASSCDYTEVNLLSKAELKEVKDLILQQCTSSVHGIRRRRIKRTKDRSIDVGALSESIVTELLREDAKLNVHQ